MLYLSAEVVDDLYALGFKGSARSGVADSQLHPEIRRTRRECVVYKIRHALTSLKHINKINGAGNRCNRGVTPNTFDILVVRIDRHHLVILAEVLRDTVCLLYTSPSPRD